MKATTRRGMADQVLPPAAKKKKKKTKGSSSAAVRGFMCGCGGAKSVSVVSRLNLISFATTPLTTTSAKSTRMIAPTTVVHDADATPSVDALLVQLRELEHGVRALGVRDDNRGAPPPPPASRRHRRSGSESAAGRRRRGRLEEESVAVVTESDDPLGDFRRSMAQMIVENDITAGAELRELLQRFISLNAACHHRIILGAFADVWDELFAGGGGGGGGHDGDHHHHRLRRRPLKPSPYSVATS